MLCQNIQQVESKLIDVVLCDTALQAVSSALTQFE